MSDFMSCQVKTTSSDIGVVEPNEPLTAGSESSGKGLRDFSSNNLQETHRCTTSSQSSADSNALITTVPVISTVQSWIRPPLQPLLFVNSHQSGDTDSQLSAVAKDLQQETEELPAGEMLLRGLEDLSSAEGL
uniref:RUBCNL n=2 Tax=Macrostomum lignano TaxID=282301 RepID=A0A1I8IT01_9PLAT